MRENRRNHKKGIGKEKVEIGREGRRKKEEGKGEAMDGEEDEGRI